MNAFRNVIEHPSSITARQQLAAEWMRAGRLQGTLLSKVLAVKARDLPLHAMDDARDEIRERLDAHGREWAGRIADLTTSYDYELGLISACTATGKTLVEHGAELFALAPILSLGVSDPLHFAEVLRLPQLKQLKGFYVESKVFNDSDAALLAKCTNLGGLIKGSIDCRGLTRAGVQLLVNSPVFDNMVACYMTIPERLLQDGIASGRQSLIKLDDHWYMQNDAAAASYWNAAVAVAHQTWNMYVEWPPLLDDLYWTA